MYNLWPIKQPEVAWRTPPVHVIPVVYRPRAEEAHMPAAAADASELTFGRHETFPFRYGWLQRGVEAARQDPDVFNRDEAGVVLGVGKNMVRSIRFWCTATKLLEEKKHPENSRLSHLVPTSWAKRLLLTKRGWDPYFEDDGSLWLLQWLLLAPPTIASAWSFFFNRYRSGEFTRDRVTTDLLAHCQMNDAKRLALTTLRRDVDCLVRMYVPRGVEGDGRLSDEDTLDCPFGELGLVSCDPTRRFFRRHIGPKRTLPGHVLVYALAQQANRGAARSLSVAAAAYDEASPGAVFGLDEPTIEGLVEGFVSSRTLKGVQFSTVGGLRHIYFEDELREDPVRILEHYYRGRF